MNRIADTPAHGVEPTHALEVGTPAPDLRLRTSPTRRESQLNVSVIVALCRHEQPCVGARNYQP
jgi:hypothetical protein